MARTLLWSFSCWLPQSSMISPRSQPAWRLYWFGQFVFYSMVWTYIQTCKITNPLRHVCSVNTWPCRRGADILHSVKAAGFSSDPDRLQVTCAAPAGTSPPAGGVRPVRRAHRLRGGRVQADQSRGGQGGGQGQGQALTGKGLAWTWALGKFRFQ